MMRAQRESEGAPKRLWWEQARFGLFLHWGLYSVAAGDWNGQPTKGNEHFMLHQLIPLKEYGTLAGGFNPINFNADQWVSLAKNAGMKYIVITAKHHEGFAMFDSPSSAYNIVQSTPWGRDPMKDLTAACQKYGLKLCFYYSLGRDWEDPDVPTNWPVKAGRSNTWDYPNEDGKVFSRYFERKVKPQLRELLTQYGPVGVLWFDTPELISREQSMELRQLILQLQPTCLINNRIGGDQGDYDVVEQELAVKNPSKPWEACITMSGGWGYNRHDNAYKTPEVLVRDLIEVVSKGGNFLLNIGPTRDGDLPPPAVERLKAVGEWMAINGEAIYGTYAWKIQGEGEAAKAPHVSVIPAGIPTMKDAVNDATSKETTPDIRFTAKGNDLYIFARSWHDPQLIVKALAEGREVVKSVELLGAHVPATWHQDGNGLTITRPANYSTALPIYTFKASLEQKK